MTLTIHFNKITGQYILAVTDNSGTEIASRSFTTEDDMLESARQLSEWLKFTNIVAGTFN